MKRYVSDEPFRLRWTFVGYFFGVGLLVLFLFKPWGWDLPLLAKAAGLVGLPFIFSLIAYAAFEFFVKCIRGSNGKRDGLVLFAVFTYLTVGAAGLTYIDMLREYRAVGVALLTCSGIVLYNIIKKSGNQ